MEKKQLGDGVKEKDYRKDDVVNDINMNKINGVLHNQITEQLLKDYFSKTKRAMEKINISNPEKTPLNTIAKDIYDMAKRYYSDAKYFFNKGDFVRSFAAVNYAHAWLDIGARLGFFDVDHDSELFMVD